MTSEHAAIVRVQSAVTRYVRGRQRGLPGVEVEDVVQEAMTKLLENRSRLQPEAWEAFAVVSARNLLRDQERKDQVHHRHRHRLYAPDLADSAEDQVLAAEEQTALRRALDGLPQADADLLAARYSGERPERSIRPAAAARLARARAKLRVAYLLQHTGTSLPTARCRPVLEALSTADQRRQERLGVAQHLQACRACASYAPALLHRRRALAALHPLSWAAVAGAAALAFVRRQPARVATGTGALALMAGGAVLVSVQSTPVPAERAVPTSAARTAAAPPSASSLTVQGEPQLPRTGADIRLGPARGQSVTVSGVPADEGFWVGGGPGQRLWVTILGDRESAQQVRPGDRVWFVGEAVRLSPSQVGRLGLADGEGRQELTELGVSLQVQPSDLTVRPS